METVAVQLLDLGLAVLPGAQPVRLVVDAIAWLQRFGYLDAMFSGDGFQTAVRLFRQRYGLPAGPLDHSVIVEMQRPRCGCTDAAAMTDQPGRWNKPEVRWALDEPMPEERMPQSHQELAFVRVAMQCSKATGLIITQVRPSEWHDISVRFTMDEPGLGMPGHVLGLTQLQTGDNRAGWLKMDGAERWVFGREPLEGEFDLEVVGLHEFVHALGPDHSTRRGAVMFPVYQRGVRQLQEDDDLARLRALYAA